MKVIANRGVCVGVNRNLAPGDVVEDLDPATVQFLKHIGAVSEYAEPLTEAEVIVAAEEQADIQQA